MKTLEEYREIKEFVLTHLECIGRALDCIEEDEDLPSEIKSEINQAQLAKCDIAIRVLEQYIKLIDHLHQAKEPIKFVYQTKQSQQ